MDQRLDPLEILNDLRSHFRKKAHDRWDEHRPFAAEVAQAQVEAIDAAILLVTPCLSKTSATEE